MFKTFFYLLRVTSIILYNVYPRKNLRFIFLYSLTSCSQTISNVLKRCFNHSNEASLPKQIWKFSSVPSSASSSSRCSSSVPSTREKEAERGTSVVTSLKDTKLNAPPWSVVGNRSRHNAHVALRRNHRV